jgi:hypothetical protein
MRKRRLSFLQRRALEAPHDRFLPRPAHASRPFEPVDAGDAG